MMPVVQKPWPPPHTVECWWELLEEWETWYSGNPRRLSEFYATAQGSKQSARFWTQVKQDSSARALHMPLAQDIAQVSATLLFSEPAIIKPETETGEAAQAIDRFVKQNGLEAKLLEAAEMAAALSGVYLKLDSVPDLERGAVLSLVAPSGALPVFVRGALHEVTFWHVVKTTDALVWLLFEERKRVPKGMAISYRLFTMTANGDRITQEVELASVAETEQLGLADVVLAMERGLGVVYVPNMLPNRVSPGWYEGVADYQGAVTLLDGLDEAWSSWLRDVRLGMGRLLCNKEVTDTCGRFDFFRETFLKLDVGKVLTGDEDKKLVELVQFDMRTEEHARTCSSLVSEIVTRCGYSPQSFGLAVEGRAESGVALRIRERKSLSTRHRKARYWTTAISALFDQMQAFERATGLGNYQPTPVAVEMQDSVAPEPLEVSETLKNLKLAEAISTQTAVAMAHPDWTPEEIAEEVQLIDAAKMLVPPFENPGGDDSEFRPG